MLLRTHWRTIANSDLGGQRENDVKIGDLQQLGLALRHPGECLTALALGTVAVATANGELTISCLMGKLGNGESDRINSDAIELSSNFYSPLRALPQ